MRRRELDCSHFFCGEFELVYKLPGIALVNDIYMPVLRPDCEYFWNKQRLRSRGDVRVDPWYFCLNFLPLDKGSVRGQLNQIRLVKWSTEDYLFFVILDLILFVLCVNAEVRAVREAGDSESLVQVLNVDSFLLVEVVVE